MFTLIITVLAAIISQESFEEATALPDPGADPGMTLHEALSLRRSVRSYSEDGLTLQELSELLFAAQGITSNRGYRTAPSAGATFPLFIFVAVEDVEGLDPGVYRFDPEDNSITMVKAGSLSEELSAACLGQQCVNSAPVSMIIAADYSRTTDYYGERGVMYVHMEAGHVSQNVYLQCEALALGTVAVGAFVDEEVSEAAGLPPELVPLYVMPLGRP